MDDLNYLIKDFNDCEKNSNSLAQKKKQQQMADKLDLDPLD
jgi:hypothetical protein